ncbi:hypothetical protein TorRG33x02_153650 [Trema orientale]|uniref:Uncharacterized protein n=1 Tax=Trema orientale TaxID=63057 RepID=A0A2P5ETI6_TREOI|nr:hypothetical protein TorRG33x02_153650 [Trema orientale]
MKALKGLPLPIRLLELNLSKIYYVLILSSSLKLFVSSNRCHGRNEPCGHSCAISYMLLYEAQLAAKIRVDLCGSGSIRLLQNDYEEEEEWGHKDRCETKLMVDSEGWVPKRGFSGL